MEKGVVSLAEGLTGQTPEGDTLRVREVWEDNLEAEMQVRVQIFDGFDDLSYMHKFWRNTYFNPPFPIPCRFTAY